MGRGWSVWNGTTGSTQQANNAANAALAAQRAAATAAEAKVAKDIADKKAWDLKIGKTRKKSAGGSARTDYHTGLGESQTADIASKSLLGQ